MDFKKIHNKGQARLFQNQYLEYLTKTHPLVIWGMYIPVIVFFLYYSVTTLEFSVLKTTWIFLAGMLSWSFVEYTMHRFVFHHHAKSRLGQRISYIMHGNHHEYPRDKERLFMPPIPNMIIGVIFYFLFTTIFGTAGYPFFPGFVFGYLLYGSMHYAIHAWNPPFKWMKGLWRNHHLHHYKNTDMGFGVSNTLWDHVFGTMFDLKNEKEDKEKVKELMFQK